MMKFLIAILTFNNESKFIFNFEVVLHVSPPKPCVSDGYNVGRNYNGSERQSYITDIQKEYGMYREHDVDDANDYEEEDR